MTFKNFPDEPLSPEQNLLFEKAMVQFRAAKKAQFMRGTLIACGVFLLLFFICGMITASGYEGGKGLTLGKMAKIFIGGAIFALPPWVLVSSLTFDGGYRKDQASGREELHPQYVCSFATWKSNRKAFFEKSKKVANEQMSSQDGCALFVMTKIFMGMLILASLALWPVTAFLIGSYSFWRLLGWFVWFHPIEVMQLHYKQKSPPENEHIRGAQIVEMPDAFK